MVEYPFGAGRVIATLTTTEWRYVGDFGSLPQNKKLLANDIAYQDVLGVPHLASGSFVIGDLNSAIGTPVTFWGAQWSRDNALSGGGAPASFKGFAKNIPNNPPKCGDTWTTRPGNSSNPPDSVPDQMAVIVSSSISQSGSTISGNTPKVVVVRTNSGYQPDPGHPGTGTVVSQVCP